MTKYRQPLCDFRPFSAHLPAVLALLCPTPSPAFVRRIYIQNAQIMSLRRMHRDAMRG